MKTVLLLMGLATCLALATASSYGYRRDYSHDVTCYGRGGYGTKYQYRGDISDGCQAARQYCHAYNSGGCRYDRCSVGGGGYCGNNLCYFDNNPYGDSYRGGDRYDDRRRYDGGHHGGYGGDQYYRHTHDVTCYDRDRRGVKYQYRGDISDGCQAARQYCNAYNTGSCTYDRCSVGGGGYCGANLCNFDSGSYHDSYRDGYRDNYRRGDGWRSDWRKDRRGSYRRRLALLDKNLRKIISIETGYFSR